MLESTFSSVFGTAESLVGAVSAADFLLCCAFSVVLGAVCAGVYMFRHSYSKNFVVTLALLPPIVQMVITLVNGNLGAGIAVMGVFNLVRFRSIPGSAKDIGSVFLAMAVGLATLRITIPEDLEYDGVFDEVLNRYAAESELTEVTTTNMGSLFQLTYQLRLRERGLEKAMIDELRCLNGNLKISLGMTPQGRETL